MLKSKSWVKSIKWAFRWSDEDEKKMRIHFARMCILYEDLKLEFAGAAATDIPGLDASSVHIRRYYFLRRAFATVAEIEQSIIVLNKDKMPKYFKEWLSPDAIKKWDGIVKYFAANHALLKGWRNDMGGHFHDDATEYVLNEVDADTVGSFEVVPRGKGSEIRMPFVALFPMIALARNKPAGETIEEAVERANIFLAEAVGNCIKAIDIIIEEHIYPRFRS